jgi:hypothetical protein
LQWHVGGKAAFTPKYRRPERLYQNNSNNPIEKRTRDLPACSAVPQATAPPRNGRNNKHLNMGIQQDKLAPEFCKISGIHREENKNCSLLYYYAADVTVTDLFVTLLQTFRDNLSVPHSNVKNKNSIEMGPIGCPETSVRSYHH